MHVIKALLAKMLDMPLQSVCSLIEKQSRPMRKPASNKHLSYAESYCRVSIAVLLLYIDPIISAETPTGLSHSTICSLFISPNEFISPHRPTS